MKRFLLRKRAQRHLKKAVLMITALCILATSGCSAKTTESQEQQEKQTLKLSMVISSDAPECVKEAAGEFINRAAYYSNGELQISLSESAQVDSVLQASDTEFAFVDNEQLISSIEELKTLELPFFFKNADYQFSALNTEQTQYRLNELIAELYPMKVQLATTCGYEDLAADDSIDLTDFRKRYILAVKESFFPDEIQEDIGAREIVSDNPLGLLLEEKAEIAQADLSEVIAAVQNPSYTGEMAVLTSAHRVKTVYLLVNDQLMDKLSPSQQAAVEQAAVMSCGYCRTLADQKREEELETLSELGVSVYPVNLEKYYAMMGDIYQYEAEQMLYRPDPQLDRMIRSDGVKETF